MPFRLDDHLGVLIKKSARLFEQIANQGFDKLGVTYAQTIFLIRLWEKDGQNQAELTKSSGLKQPTVVRFLDRMERDGLIKRVKNTKDRRIFNFYLTEKAKKASQKLELHANAMNKIATSSLSNSEVKKFKEIIFIIIENLQAYLTTNPKK